MTAFASLRWRCRSLCFLRSVIDRSEIRDILNRLDLEPSVPEVDQIREETDLFLVPDFPCDLPLFRLSRYSRPRGSRVTPLDPCLSAAPMRLAPSSAGDRGANVRQPRTERPKAQ